jgi:hypothetical protein
MIPAGSTVGGAMRVLAAIVLLVGSIVLPAPSAALAGQFDGRWKVTFTPETEGKEFDDTLTFTANRFAAPAFDKQHAGLGKGEYEEHTARGPVAKFSATVKDEKQGTTAEWAGQAVGADLSGEVTITRKDGSVTRYSFKGAR